MIAFRKDQTKSKKLAILFILSIVISFFTLLSSINYVNDPSVIHDNSFDNNITVENIPSQQSLSKYNYTQILKENLQSLGSVTATNILFNEAGFLRRTNDYPNLDYDLNSKYLNISYGGTVFSKTISNAQFDNLNEKIEGSNTITVELRDVLSVRYYNASKNLEGYLIYGLRLYPSTLARVRIQNGTNPTEDLDEDNYSLDAYNFVVFDYMDYFNSDALNFTLYFYWNYDFNLYKWGLYQDFEKNIMIREKEQNFSAKFFYEFNVIGEKFLGSNLNTIDFADNLVAVLKLNLPEKGLLFNYSLKINNKTAPYSIKPDNSIKVSMTVDNSTLDLNFLTNYTIKFEHAVYKSWAIDRLVESRDIRERIYFPSLISGPDHIFVQNLVFFENDITYDQVISISSLFDRPQIYTEINRSLYEAREENSLVFTDKVVKRLGLNVTIPYLIKGETCPFILKYQTNQNLKVILTDNINMPLQGHRIDVYYYGSPYGTYISKNQAQPIAPVITNEDGEILLENVPNGNYTLRIFLFGFLLTETSANPENQINHITTDIPHFPLIILIYFSINGGFIAVGYLIYRKNKNKKKQKKKR